MNISDQVNYFLGTCFPKNATVTEDTIKLPKYQEKIKTCMKLVEEEVQELKDAIANNDIFEIQDAIVDIQWVVNNLSFFLNLPISQVETAVYLSNLSKFCKNESVAKITVEAYASGNHPDKIGEKIDCYYEKSTTQDAYIIKRASDDKILKSIDYKNAKEYHNRLFVEKIKIEYVDKYQPEDCQKNPNKLYVFGDNYHRIGMGGQAIIRNEKNSFGIPTKISPSKYLSDDSFNNYQSDLNKILDELEVQVRANLDYDLIIVFPSDGIGTGLAKMQTKCPRCFKELKQQLLNRFGIYNPKSTIIMN